MTTTIDYTAKISQILEPTTAEGALYLGSWEAASDAATLASNKIGAVLTIICGFKLAYDKNFIANHVFLDAEDSETQDISKYFDIAYDFINTNRRKGLNVFVHCFMGVSRSASLVVAYIVRKFNFDVETALTYVRSKRPQIFPNAGFLEQLRSYEKKVKTPPRSPAIEPVHKPITQVMGFSLETGASVTSPAPARTFRPSTLDHMRPGKPTILQFHATPAPVPRVLRDYAEPTPAAPTHGTPYKAGHVLAH